MKDDKLLDMLFEMFYAKQGIPDRLKQVGAEYYQDISAVPRESDNIILSPLRRRCPPWICCLLFFLNKTPGMVSFKLCNPDSAYLIQEENSEVCIDAESLAVGDVVVLRPGYITPADVILTEVNDNFATSCFDLPGARVAGFRLPEARGSIQTQNMCFAGCTVLSGQAKGVVVGTGDNTLMSILIEKGHWPVTREQAGAMHTV